MLFVLLLTADIASAVYDSELGRWLSRDPIEEDGGVNLYAYVENNPINYYDLFGLDESNWFAPNDRCYKGADKARAPKGTYMVRGHGDWFWLVGPRGEHLMPQDVVRNIKSDPCYKAGTPVCLGVCRIGWNKAFVKAVADGLKAPVYATDQYMWYWPDGGSGIGPWNPPPKPGAGQFLGPVMPTLPGK